MEGVADSAGEIARAIGVVRDVDGSGSPTPALSFVVDSRDGVGALTSGRAITVGSGMKSNPRVVAVVTTDQRLYTT